MNRHKYKFSIIIPVYNSSSTIANTIDSLRKQIYNKFQLIFVNDGSSDNSIEVINKEMTNTSINYKIINKVNSGVSATRNLGLENSEGEYVYFLDSDDCIKETLFEDLNNILKKDSADILGFTFRTVNGYDKYSLRNKEVFKGYKKLSAQELLNRYLRKDVRLHICSVVFKREFLCENSIRFSSNFHYAEDVEFLIKTLIDANKIIYIPIEYFYYVNNPNSQMKKFDEKRFSGLDAITSCIDYGKIKIDNKEILTLLNNRFLEEILYIVRGSILTSNSIECDCIVKNIILENKDRIKNYKVFSENDKEIKKELELINKDFDLYRKYLKRKYFYINLTRTIKRRIKELIYG